MKAPDNPLALGISWILENRADPEGKKWSQRSLAAAAGLTHSHVWQLKSGNVAPESAEIGTIRAIARAGNVRTEWLLTGRGPREPFEVAPSPPVRWRGVRSYLEQMPDDYDALDATLPDDAVESLRGALADAEGRTRMDVLDDLVAMSAAVGVYEPLAGFDQPPMLTQGGPKHYVLRGQSARFAVTEPRYPAVEEVLKRRAAEFDHDARAELLAKAARADHVGEAMANAWADEILHNRKAARKGKLIVRPALGGDDEPGSGSKKRRRRK